MKILIESANWVSDNTELQRIRTEVFVKEQAVPIELEWDDKDSVAKHWLAFNGEGQAIGTIRMLADGHIGRMAVAKHCRQQGVGRALLAAVIEFAKSEQFYELYLYAQNYAVDFYSKAGFICEGETFMDANIPHQAMRLRLRDQRLLGINGGDFSISDHPTAAKDLISQVQQRLRILSFNLDPDSFDCESIVNTISTLARKSRYTEIRLLVADISSIVKQGHQLLNLQRRLPSNIALKKVSCEPHLLHDNLIIADNTGFICQSIKEPEKICGNYNNRPTTQSYIEQFDELWNRAIIDPDLRQLDL